MNDKYLTISDAAKVLGKSVPRVYQLIKEYNLQKFKVPGKTLLLREEVEKLNEPQPIKD